MIAILAALVLQAKEPEPITLPVGSSEAFQSLCQDVQAAVDAKDWAEAKRLAGRLPDRNITMVWDDSKLSENQKEAFAKARDEGIAEWKRGIPDLSVTFAKKGELKISFVEELPPNLDTVGPAGAVFFNSPADGEPFIEAVWALVRGPDKKPVREIEIVNEMQYAIGAVLGLARNPQPKSIMFRTEDYTPARIKYTLADGRLVDRIIEASDRIRKAVNSELDPKLGAPKIFIDPLKFVHDPVPQFGLMAFTVQVTNQGNSPLEFRLVPDCGCFVVGGYNGNLAPGQTTVVDIVINTAEFTGMLRKVLFVYSNDPQFPIRQIPLEATVRPAYRFVDITEGPVLYVDSNGAKFETILVIDDERKFDIKGISVAGVSAMVSKEPWTGELDWPEIGEGKKKRSGYKLTALVSSTAPVGRVPMQLQIDTNDQLLTVITKSISVQKGIVSVPLSLYFGQIPKSPAKAVVIVSSPGRPFKITKVESDTQFVKASFEHYRNGDEYKLTAEFTGDAPFGRFRGTITVHTDDPNQPTVKVPFEGEVR